VGHTSASGVCGVKTDLIQIDTFTGTGSIICFSLAVNKFVLAPNIQTSIHTHA
jgi:hypothetical protein